MSQTYTTIHLSPHESISDTAARIALAFDTNSPTLLATAFTSTATYDLTSFSFLDSSFTLLSATALGGRESLVSALLTGIGPMDTTHMLSNFRTEMTTSGKEAKLSCYTLAQHWREGEGRNTKAHGDQSFLMGNRWEGELVFDSEADGLWRFQTFKITPIWCQGDFEGVMKGSGVVEVVT